MVTSNFKTRANETFTVKKIINEEVLDYWDWYAQRDSISLIAHLQQEAAAIREAELTRAFNKLEHLHLNDKEKSIIAILAKRIEGKLLAKPLQAIKQQSLQNK